MEGQRQPNDSDTVYALSIVCERWSLILVRELLAGPKRFTDLKRGLPKISSNVLALRLRRLVGAGVLEHYTLPPPAASQVYALTAWGLRLGPVIRRLGVWEMHSPVAQEKSTL